MVARIPVRQSVRAGRGRPGRRVPGQAELGPDHRTGLRGQRRAVYVSRQRLPDCRRARPPAQAYHAVRGPRARLGVSESVLLLWDEELMRYDLGGTHPMHPGRLELTMALARDLSILARSSLLDRRPEAGDRRDLGARARPCLHRSGAGSAVARVRSPPRGLGLSGQDNLARPDA